MMSKVYQGMRMFTTVTSLGALRKGSPVSVRVTVIALVITSTNRYLRVVYCRPCRVQTTKLLVKLHAYHPRLPRAVIGNLTEREGVREGFELHHSGVL